MVLVAVRFRVVGHPNRLSATVPRASRVSPPLERHCTKLAFGRGARAILTQPNRHLLSTNQLNLDGIQKAKPGEIADMLHMDMMAHRKKTAEFNASWKRVLCFAAFGLSVVSMLKAIEKASEGDPGWMERGLTSANAGLIAAWVALVDLVNHRARSTSPFVQLAVFALSLYQLLAWWNSRQGGEQPDFPVAVILLIVAVAAIASMESTLETAERAFRASGSLSEKVANGSRR